MLPLDGDIFVKSPSPSKSFPSKRSFTSSYTFPAPSNLGPSGGVVEFPAVETPSSVSFGVAVKSSVVKVPSAVSFDDAVKFSGLLSGGAVEISVVSAGDVVESAVFFSGGGFESGLSSPSENSS